MSSPDPSTVHQLSASKATPPSPKRLSVASALALVPKAFEAFSWNRRDTASAIAREIAQHLADSHPAVARRLSVMLERELRPTPLPVRPEGLVDIHDPRHGFDAVMLPDDVLKRCRDIVAEHRRCDELAAFHLSPRHKVLLSGPPGDGKTMLAEALAYELDVPFLAVSHGGLVDSYLGATGKNIDKLFAYAGTAPCVVFIDEFDGLAIKRAQAGDVGEIRRVTNHLLIAIEKLPPTAVLICATNAEALIDDAIRRRFDFDIEIPAPTRELKVQCARRELRPELTPGTDVSQLADEVADLGLENLFFVTERCRQIRRDLVLNGGTGIQSLLITNS